MYTGPNIIKNGLVLHLDAANTKSYPGTGTTWTDLSGRGNNGTLTNGPTFNSSNNGSIILDGVNDGVQLVHNNSWVISPTDKFSLCSWFYADPTIPSTGCMIFSHQKCNSPAFQILVSPTSLNFRIAGVSSVFATYTANVTGIWNYVTTTFDSTTGNMRLYLNGNLVATAVNNLGWSSYIAGFSEVWLGRRFDCGGTNEFKGRISSFSYYKGKELTASEILQNYNSTKSRYGL